jgi:hypothetical protein
MAGLTPPFAPPDNIGVRSTAILSRLVPDICFIPRLAKNSPSATLNKHSNRRAHSLFELTAKSNKSDGSCSRVQNRSIPHCKAVSTCWSLATRSWAWPLSSNRSTKPCIVRNVLIPRCRLSPEFLARLRNSGAQTHTPISKKDRMKEKAKRDALLTYRPTLTRREPMLRKANPRTGSPGGSEFAQGVEAEIRHRWIFQKRRSVSQFPPSK